MLTILESFVSDFQQHSVSWVHHFRLGGLDGEEGSVKRREILLQEVRISWLDLISGRSAVFETSGMVESFVLRILFCFRLGDGKRRCYSGLLESLSVLSEPQEAYPRSAPYQIHPQEILPRCQ